MNNLEEYNFDFFLSYSSEDKDIVLKIANYLKDKKFSVWFDQWNIEPGDDIFLKIEEGLEYSKCLLLMMSKNSFKSDWTNLERNTILFRDPSNRNRRFIPCLISDCSIPNVIRRYSYLDLRNNLEDLKKIIGESNNYVNSEIDYVENIEISPSKLPVYTNYLIGRDDEIFSINEALENKAKVIKIIAWGGVGKTALVSFIREEFSDKFNYIYDWSFYDQGTSSKRIASVESFIDNIFNFLPNDKNNSYNIYEKTDYILKFLSKNRCLVILDGIEPLQFPISDRKNNGKIKSGLLDLLLTGAADSNKGLMLLTSRQDIFELNKFSDKKVKTIKLDNLSEASGAKLLKHLGVNGEEDTLRNFSRKFSGHALSLMLAGNYTRIVLNGDINDIRFSDLFVQDGEESSHAKKTMGSYKKWLSTSPELHLLRTISLFDRPVTWSELSVLIESNPIKGVTSEINKISRASLLNVINRLKLLGLVYPNDGIEEFSIDMHPLIKEFFLTDVKTYHFSGWLKGNEILYEFLSKTPYKKNNRIEDFTPLFSAIAHGCNANLEYRVFKEVYEPKIKMNEHVQDARAFGGLSADLSALENFFERPWDKIKENLPKNVQAEIFNELSFSFRSEGDLSDAIDHAESAIRIYKEIENNESCAMLLGNLSELYMLKLEIKKSIELSKEGVIFGKKSDTIWKHIWIQQAKNAYNFFQKGEYDEASYRFEEAEKLQQIHDLDHKYFYGVLSYKFIDFLLNKHENKILALSLGLNKEHLKPLKDIDFIEKRARDVLENDLSDVILLHTGLSYLSLAKITLLKNINDVGEIKKSDSLFEKADYYIRTSGRVEYLMQIAIDRIKYNIFINRIELSKRFMSDLELLLNQKHIEIFSTESKYLSCIIDYKEGKFNFDEVSSSVRILNRFSYRKNLEILEFILKNGN